MSARDAVQHVTYVAYERVGYRIRVDPRTLCFNLQTSRHVLSKNGEQPIVRVLSDPQAGIGLRRIVEDSEQDQRIGCIAAGKVRFWQTKTEGNPVHQRMAKPRHR